MAKKNGTTDHNNAATTTTETTNGTTVNAVNKSAAIRDYAAKHPDAKPAEIAKALESLGVNASRVSSVLTVKKPSVDIDKIKAAATFVRGFDGSIDDATKAIQAVGAFVEACGGANHAIAAIEAYQVVAKAVAA